MEEASVVVIDDNESVLFFLGELLSTYEIPYRTAASGQEGLRIIAECRPRLAVLDVKLGSMTGLEVAREVIRLSPNTRIAFMTGYSRAIPPEVKEEVPVLAVLQKPFEVEDLISIIQKALL